MAIVDDLSQGRFGTHGREGKTGLARRREQSRVIQKMENSGNEAKKWLKTKENRFCNAANYACFACKLAQIAH
jgi:hypothetical protein